MRVTLTILYILCLYDIYLYLPDVFALFSVDFFPPDINWLIYFDAAMLLTGGVVVGSVLLKTDSRLNKYLGLVMIVLNFVLTPLFLIKALL